MTQSRPNHGPSGPAAASASLAILRVCRTMPICAGKGAHGPPPTDTRLLMRRKGSSGVSTVQGGLGVLGTMGKIWCYAIHGLVSGA